MKLDTKLFLKSLNAENWISLAAFEKIKLFNKIAVKICNK